MDERNILLDIASKMQKIVDRPSTMDDFISKKLDISHLDKLKRDYNKHTYATIYRPNRSDFRKKKLLVFCVNHHEYHDFCRDKMYTSEETLPITNTRFNLGMGMTNGYYTTLERFDFNTADIDKRNIFDYLKAHGFTYIPLKDL